MRGRRLVLIGIVALVTFAAPAAAGASGDPAAQQLAERYAPIAMLREQTDPPCKTSEEQYQPTGVGTVLGNPTVTLNHELPDGLLEDVKRAPTAADIAALRDGYYLDLEGKVLGDTCVYARAFRKLVREDKAPAVTYAPPSTSATGRTAPASAATTPPNRCANCGCGRCRCRKRRPNEAPSSGSATAAAGANGKRATTTARPGR